MSAANPLGQEQFWKDGRPWAWLHQGAHDAGTQKFWSDGMPAIGLMPAATFLVLQDLPHRPQHQSIMSM
jgi:hypothetical protein